MLSEDTWPKAVDVSRLRKPTSIPLSWRMTGIVGPGRGGRYRSMREYEPGLHEVADGCHAYLQPGGGWGWSNAGLVVGDGGSLRVDTLFDLDLTARMLEAMAPAVLTAPIGTVVNTHANGDHCYGNQLLGGTEIVASSAAAEEMGEVPPALLAGLVAAEGEVGDLFRSFFGEFGFEGIELTLPTLTFDGRLDLDAGGRAVELIEAGPATPEATFSPTCRTPGRSSPATSSS